MVVFLVHLFLQGFFMLLALVYLLSVLVYCAPLINVAFDCGRVVALLLVEKVLDSVSLGVERVLHAIRHFEGIHHGVAAFVVSHSYQDK
jgi:hypothetical protein